MRSEPSGHVLHTPSQQVRFKTPCLVAGDYLTCAWPLCDKVGQVLTLLCLLLLILGLLLQLQLLKRTYVCMQDVYIDVLCPSHVLWTSRLLHQLELEVLWQDQ